MDFLYYLFNLILQFINKIEPANLPKTMVSHVLVLFRKNTPLVQ